MMTMIMMLMIYDDDKDEDVIDDADDIGEGNDTIKDTNDEGGKC